MGKKINLDKIKNLAAIAAVFGVGLIFIVRAAITGITYDEAFTYLAYAKPLMEWPSLTQIELIYWESVANNHWLNTFLIALICGVTKIQYSEFLLRLPSILFGCSYLFVVLRSYQKKRMDGCQFVLLLFCYYMHEFFGLARGYGMATVLVLFGLLLYDAWVKEECTKHWQLLLSVGGLIASAYANSVTLMVCFCIGILMAYRLIRNKQLLSFIRKCWPVLLIYAVAGFLIVKYHFHVSGEGMPLWAADSSSLLGLVGEYVSMFLGGDTVIKVVSILLVIATIVSIVYLIIKKKILTCDFGLACVFYFICLLLMNVVFGRGGFYGRTLLPAYPLVALGIYDLLSKGIQEFEKSYKQKREESAEKSRPIKVQMLKGIIEGVVILIVAFMYLSKVDLLRTRDWYNDYNIKVEAYNNPDYETSREHASSVFYEEKKNWDMEHLFKDYTGEEENSYQLQ